MNAPRFKWPGSGKVQCGTLLRLGTVVCHSRACRRAFVYELHGFDDATRVSDAACVVETEPGRDFSPTKQRGKRRTQSALRSINGIGPTTSPGTVPSVPRKGGVLRSPGGSITPGSTIIRPTPRSRSLRLSTNSPKRHLAQRTWRHANAVRQRWKTPSLQRRTGPFGTKSW